MAVIGCYSLDLYCDTGGEPYGAACPKYVPGLQHYPRQYTGPTEGDCITQARKQGWTFSRDKQQGFCPTCSKIRKRH